MKNQANEYVETLKPILYLLKMNGVLPIQLERRGKSISISTLQVTRVGTTAYFKFQTTWYGS